MASEGPDFAERLRDAMKAANLKQNQLERLCAFPSRGYVSRLLDGTRGKRPSHDTIAKLSKHLHVREAWLATGEGPRQEEYETLSPRKKAIAAGLDNQVLPETIEEFDRRFPESAYPDKAGYWWLGQLMYLDREVRLQLAEAKATRKTQRVVREANERRKKPPSPSVPPTPALTGTTGRRRRSGT